LVLLSESTSTHSSGITGLASAPSGNLRPSLSRHPDHVGHLDTLRGVHRQLNGGFSGHSYVLVEKAKHSALLAAVAWLVRAQDELAMCVGFNLEGQVLQLRIVQGPVPE
jgi:hypothetical protein